MKRRTSPRSRPGRVARMQKPPAPSGDIEMRRHLVNSDWSTKSPEKHNVDSFPAPMSAKTEASTLRVSRLIQITSHFELNHKTIRYQLKKS
ncbi:hypothetical protein BGLA2_40013 [Burkholderia gladioli]|nr:hypothetical protein BGLA2_40013 [Burkholderia gladioli]